MKIAIAQLELKRGDIPFNTEKHIAAINVAIESKAEAIFFSELSLTAYEPQLAEELSFVTPFNTLEQFQKLSDENDIVIGIGAPTKDNEGIKISMLVFKKNSAVQVYSKQYLHQDELAYFKKGHQSMLIDIKGFKVAPAICYESLQLEHLEEVMEMGADAYLASTAKSKEGVSKAKKYFSTKYQRYQIPIMMVNNIGPSDDFIGGGRSSIWDKEGNCTELAAKGEGILYFNAESNHIMNEKFA